MVIAGVSTLLFNGNPLLRYDAYYILADLTEIPNLASRSLQYWSYLSGTLSAWGARDRETPPASRSEKVWMLVYGLRVNHVPDFRHGADCPVHCHDSSFSSGFCWRVGRWRSWR